MVTVYENMVNNRQTNMAQHIQHNGKILQTQMSNSSKNRKHTSNSYKHHSEQMVQIVNNKCKHRQTNMVNIVKHKFKNRQHKCNTPGGSKTRW
jgi:hypothetical protein